MTSAKTFLFYIAQTSIYLKIPFYLKFLFFITISTFALISRDITANALTCICLFCLILETGFFKHNFRHVQLLFVSLGLFFAIWLLFSKTPGKIIYIQFPWMTFISEQTITSASIAASRWFLICLGGLFFLIISSQEELIRELIKLKAPYQFILIITIAFNTVAFTIESLPQIEHALNSRGVANITLHHKIRRFLYIGTAILMDNIKRISLLRISYLLESLDIQRIYKSS